jgi:hypothetical protein
MDLAEETLAKHLSLCTTANKKRKLEHTTENNQMEKKEEQKEQS